MIAAKYRQVRSRLRHRRMAKQAVITELEYEVKPAVIAEGQTHWVTRKAQRGFPTPNGLPREHRWYPSVVPVAPVAGETWDHFLKRIG